MDPQVTWDQLLAAYAARDCDTIAERAEALLHWLRRGGFPPRATTGSDLGPAWDRAVALAACQFALAHVRGGAA